MSNYAASRTDAASTDYRLDHGHQAIVLPVGTDAGHPRTTGRGALGSCGEDHGARQGQAVHLGPGMLSGLWLCLSRPHTSDEPKPLPEMSKRKHRSASLRHRFTPITIYPGRQQCIKPLGCLGKDGYDDCTIHALCPLLCVSAELFRRQG